MTGMTFRAGPPLAEVRRMLEAASLPSLDLEDAMMADFVAGYEGERLAGVVGVERFGADGLLRSLVTEPARRDAGLGRSLVAEIERHAAAAGIGCLYLLTETARDYFLRLGYRDCDRAAAPGAIRRSREFSSLCPDDAAFMCKRL